VNILDKIVASERDAANFGFKWENPQQIKAQILSEITEVDVHLQDGNQTKLQQEIGDLLHAVLSLTVYCGFNPTKTLTDSVEKFERRLSLVKRLAADEGLISLNGKSFVELMDFWDRAKAIE
jgi:uncharacterized protein YabN with tetrapyrrole methylase and pyrophosphatase domain